MGEYLANNLIIINKASKWATKYLNHRITKSNISYLLQYGRIKKYKKNNLTLIDKKELKKYYRNQKKALEQKWKKGYDKDINWKLSFKEYKERERTKHVHRLHPYKGKFIPQLVEYFIDDHIDEFKQEIYFNKGDIILDPFCGSGTALIQANELGLHAVGIDISAFNKMITNAKLVKYDINKLEENIKDISKKFSNLIRSRDNLKFGNELKEKLNEFNKKYFPSPEFKRSLRRTKIDEKKYGREKEKKAIAIFENLQQKYKIELKQEKNELFIDKWYLKPLRDEIDFLFNEIKKIEDKRIKKILAVILSRTMRSCRATTHSNLGTLRHIQKTPYYCKKHKKICKPLFTINKWWRRYTKDTIKRIKQFNQLRTNTFQLCVTGDSRTIDLEQQISKSSWKFGKMIKNKKIKGIFSSPPYVGLINYHEQHAYAYDLFGFERRDKKEIGPLFKGKGKKARESYVKGVSEVLINCKKYLQDDFEIFLVANDKFNLYPQIAKKSALQVVDTFKRPVLNRVEKK